MRRQFLRLATLQNVIPCLHPACNCGHQCTHHYDPCNRRTARLLLYIGATFSPGAVHTLLSVGLMVVTLNLLSWANALVSWSRL